MSEYQYYEFQTVDRPLTRREMDELRAMSTRATITPTRFQNVYHWGDLKGRPLAMVKQYFDAFVYVANWGTHHFMLRLPRSLFDPGQAQTFAVTEEFNVHTTADHVILEFLSHDDEGMDWVDDDEAEGWMPALLSLRAELLAGDTRALYLGWLAGLDTEEVDEQDQEPPVPAGLGQLSAALQTLAEFLRIDEDLLATATARSAKPPPGPSPAELQRWIAALPLAEKDTLLHQLAGNAPAAQAQLQQRFRQAHARPEAAAPGEERAVGQLLAAAEERAAVRKREEAARAAAERERRERAAAIARAKHLDSLVGREQELWRQIHELIEVKRSQEYDQALRLLVDLDELSIRQDEVEDFRDRLRALRERYAKRRALLDRLSGAGLLE